MTIQALDHVNIRTADLQATVAFYRDVLGMEARPVPGQTEMVRGAWLYDGAGRAVIHVGHKDARYPTDDSHPWAGTAGAGAVHHVALACHDQPEAEARLTAHGVAFVRNAVPQISLTQLFVTDPNGILLELNFHGP